jgi:site-specific DNA-methyltransferase (adenine-specific)
MIASEVPKIEVWDKNCFDFLPTIPDNSIDLVLTDPPYGLTDCEWDNAPDFDLMWKELKRVGKENCAYVFTCKQPFTTDLIISNREWFRYEWIWEKEKGVNFITAKKKPMISHENILVFYQKQPTYNPQMVQGEPYIKKQKDCTAGETHGWVPNPTDKVSNGMRYPKTIIRFSRDMNRDKDNNHPTQKPVALMEYLINTYSNEGDTVLDPFAGSFTTAVACVNINRNCIGIEALKKYCDIGIYRITNSLMQTKLF